MNLIKQIRERFTDSNGVKINTYNTVDNRRLLPNSFGEIKVTNVDLCKRLCDHFDECKGFTHDQIGGICQFYGPSSKIDLDYHIGHMATFLKEGEAQDAYEFFKTAVSRIENALNLYDESEQEKKSRTYKIKAKLSAKEAHDRNRIYNNINRNYTTLNSITNVSFKDSTPELPYHTLDEIDGDILQLTYDYDTTAYDYENILTAHDTLVIIFDQLELVDSENYVDQIKDAIEKTRILVQQQKFLIGILKNYRYFLVLKKALNDLHGELDSSCNEIIYTGKSILEDFSILPPQSIKAKYERIEDHYKIMMSYGQKIKKMQKILFAFDETKVGMNDQQFLIEENNALVNKIFTSMEMYSYLHESLAMSTNKTATRDTKAATCKNKMYDRVDWSQTRFDDFSSHNIPQMPLVLKKTPQQQIVRTYEGEYIKF